MNLTYRGALMLAAIAGVIMPFAYSPYDLYPLTFISLAMLFAAWLSVSPKRAFIVGGVFGLALFGTGTSWIFISIHDHGQVGWLLSVSITALFTLVLAFFPAFAGLISRRLLPDNMIDSRYRLAVIMVFPAVWTFFEWCRGWFLTGFPWLNIGYSQIEAPLAPLAPMIGVYGLSLLTAISSALMLCTFWNPKGDIKGGYLALLVCLWTASISTSTIQWTQPVDQPIQVSLIQGNIPQDIKWAWEMRQTTLELYTRLTEQHWDSDLIIWPETALTTFYHEALPFLNALKNEAEQHQTDMLVGLIYQDSNTRAYFNSMISLGSQPTGFYHKHHLVPFTEYLPLQSVLNDFIRIIDVPMSDFSSGDAVQTPLNVAGKQAAISICFEDAFGEETIRNLGDAHFLVNVSNDAWFGTSSAPAQHLQIARMRALETGRYLLRATNTGLTAIIDEKGIIKAQAPQFIETVLTGEVQSMTGHTPYTRIGNSAALIMIAILLLGGIMLKRRQSTQQ